MSAKIFYNKWDKEKPVTLRKTFIMTLLPACFYGGNWGLDNMSYSLMVIHLSWARKYFHQSNHIEFWGLYVQYWIEIYIEMLWNNSSILRASNEYNQHWCFLSHPLVMSIRVQNFSSRTITLTEKLLFPDGNKTKHNIITTNRKFKISLPSQFLVKSVIICYMVHSIKKASL
jgi:hypothetical protein